MADFNSSLPVRTQTNGDVAVKVVDGTVVSNALTVDSSGRVTVKLDDSTGLGITSTLIGSKQSLDVNVANTTAIPISGTVTTINASVSNTGATPPAQATYIGGSVTTAAPTYTTGQMNPLSLTTSGLLRVDGSGATQPVSGTVTANQGGAPWSQNITQVGGSTLALGQTTMSASIPVAIASNQSTLNTKDNADGPVTPGTVAANSMLMGIQFNTALPTLSTGQQAALQSDASGRLLVGSIASALPTGANTIGAVTQASGPWTQNLTQLSGATPSATNSLPTQIATAGAFVSATNPLPVIIDPQGAGTAINDYKDAAAISVGASDDHLYTALGTVGLRLQQVFVSASGKCKAIVAIETGVATGVYTTIFVAFNSTASPAQAIPIPSQPLVAAGVRVKVTMTNLDLLAQDLYSTISGFYN